MNALQWALLILGAVAVVALIATSRRERRALTGWQSPSSRKEPVVGSEAAPAGRDVAAPAAAASPVPFDEFGVGKPRRRPGEAPPAPKPAARSLPVAPTELQLDLPVASTAKPTPAFLKPAAPKAEPAKAAAKPAAKPADKPEKILALYIAEYEGTKILGPKIHAALNAQSLRYDARKKAYDRLQGEQAIYSVTSLTAPGHLDPAEAARFSTPGLALFMRLPGPAQPTPAFRDMLATAHALSQSLNAVVFDADHKPLTEDKLRALAAEVEEWAGRQAVPG
ncbi:MAG: hypothetical protein HYV18_07275 [Gammaproteobacteria bacterium]|nr:hypothetical protein [Gammaproteobacteria bacterium]